MERKALALDLDGALAAVNRSILGHCHAVLDPLTSLTPTTPIPLQTITEGVYNGAVAPDPHTLAAAQRARASADALIYSYVQALQRASAALTTAYYAQRFKEDLRHAYAVDIMDVVVCVCVHTLAERCLWAQVLCCVRCIAFGLGSVRRGVCGAPASAGPKPRVCAAAHRAPLSSLFG